MRVRLLFFALCLALSRAAHAADPLSEDIPVPGGATALARALGIDAVPDRARFLTELTRVVYSAPEVTTTEALLRQLTIHVRSIAKNGRAAQAAMSKDDLVPVPLSSRTWSQAVFRRPVSTSDLFPAILGDHDAALLAHGLAALDDETLRFMNDHPALLSDLYEDGAAAFGPFAGSLHIRDNRVAVPGGAAAIPLWEAVVDQSTLTPELFVRRLFDRNDGRIAYLYDAVSQFPADTRAFALGLSITDGRLRVDRFKALAKALEAFTGWTPREQPFRRLPYDPLLVIAQVSLDEGGRPRSAGRAFWTQVFESADLSLQQLRSPRSGDPIDAAWIAESILHAGVDSQRDRIEQLTFGLRVFGSQATADAVVALRALPRYRMLMLTLERMGIADPAVHAAAARHAARLSALGPEDGFVALSQFQGALNVLVRLRTVRGLSVQQVEQIVASLAAVPLQADRYRGGVARWMAATLAPAIDVDVADFDRQFIAALSGSSASRGPESIVSWEDSVYHLDLAAPEERRLTAALLRLGAPSIGRALGLATIAERLSAPGGRAEDVESAIAALESLRQREVAVRAVRELSRLTMPRDAQKARAIAAELHRLADDVLAESLLALSYALSSGSDSTFGRGNLSLRHDFGLAQTGGERRVRMPWLEPFEQFQPGVPWHVTGSLLGLDLGLSPLALRRISADTLPGAPVLGTSHKEVFTKTVPLLNPFDLTDADQSAIVEAIARGRRRVLSLTSNAPGLNALEAIADEIAMDGWRRRAARWALANEPEQVGSLFALTELLHLGRPPSGALRFDAWGVASGPWSGCLCTMFPAIGRTPLLMGRWPTGALATQVADLNLRVAVALSDLHLPAALAREVLAAAIQDYVDRVRPLYPDDWLTLVRAAQAVTMPRIEDYLSALTADGPLVPYTSTDGGRP